MIRFGTGTYNVRDSEDVIPFKSAEVVEASPGNTLISNSSSKSSTSSSSSSLKCIVTFLDDTEHEFEFHKHALGEELLKKVYDHLELVEKDFFGLQFVCVVDVETAGSRMRWIDPRKSIKRQMMCPPYHLFFRVKFYVSNPSKLVEEYTRYQVYLQLRKDILEGKLPCTEQEAAILGSYAAQSELGDYSPDEHKENYLDKFYIVPHQSASLTRVIAQYHKHHTGQFPADAEYKFLEVAKTLPLYGFDLYEAKDNDNLDILVGVNCSGISIFKNDIILTSFPWAIIVKLSFKRKFFNVQMKEYDNGSSKDSVYAFNAISPPNCKMLWKSCIEHHTFFRLIAPPIAPQKSLFHLGSRFRYSDLSGRTEYQSVEEMRRRAQNDKNFNRNYSMTHGKYKNNNSREGLISQNECQASSSLSTTSNSDAFSATSAADFASRFSHQCRRLLPRRQRRTPSSSALQQNIIRRRMNQITEINPVSALPDFIQQWLPKPSASIKVSHEMTIPENSSDHESHDDGECESAAPSLAGHRRSLASVSTSTPAPPSSQSVILRNSNNGASTLTVRVRPSSRNSSILGVDDAPSPATSSAYSNATARSSLILPSSASSSSHYYQSYPQNQRDQQRFLNASPYDTTATLIPNSSTPIISPTIGGNESPRIWRSPNHTTTMIINDQNSQACTSNVHHPCNSLSLTPNSCRKSMVLNGTPSSNGVASTDHTVIKNNYINSNGNGVYQVSNNLTNNDYPTYNGGTVSRRSVINGTSPYKGSLRVGQNAGNKMMNGSARNSISSYSSSFTNGSNGYENGSARKTRQSPTRQHSNSPTSITSEDSTVVVRMIPDAQDRFGFNVSGGYDRGYPVIVSRVVSGSPADRCHPRLNVGDMVLKINGQDISLWSYERVVSCIRNIRTSTQHGEITLTIKPNVYRCGEVDDSDQQSQSAPEVMHVAETVPRSDKLAQSLLLLKESLDAGKIVRQFELLYRKKPGLSMNDSRLTSNITKNRYRDVVPYDLTRVKLERAPSGDYINANHVNMEIPSSGIVNRYIACQGPLANTSGDFWYMVWEQGCTTIAMLTTLVEKGRVKCHQYWPSRKETLDYGNLQITNVSERIESHGHYREFAIRNKSTREERRVTQMQYTAWPDHGVPDSPKHFIDFVAEVRRARNGSLDPIIVHCSAGIGRTGVLILMETASCLIEANEPVYPLDIVRTMRDQRAMLIQTSEQYVFVCESILRAYKEDIIRPLAEYQKCR